jgi:N utilization substance protein A
MDISAEAKRAVSALFGETEEEIQKISELPGISQRLVEMLEKNKIADIESLVALTPEQFASLEGITAEDIQTLHKIIEENVEIVEEEAAAEEAEQTAESDEDGQEAVGEEAAEEAAAEAGEAAEAQGAALEESAPADEKTDEDTYECPECGAAITPDMATCPKCGVGLTFEESVEDEPASPAEAQKPVKEE